MAIETDAQEVPLRQVRALFGETTLRVYQAYSPEIADKALAAQRFVSPFKRGRMTWIKPSFLWMMYRSGWGEKVGQERILAIDIRRTGFEWGLGRACLSHFDPAIHSTEASWHRSVRESPVRVQWDPERTLTLSPLPYRSLQVGLSGEAVDAYVDEWIQSIEDVTPLAKSVAQAVRKGDLEAARSLIPVERPCALPNEVRARIGA
jgi:hypothetical protein